MLRTLAAFLRLTAVGVLLSALLSAASFIPVARRQEGGDCISESSPNPHALEYPSFVSGNLNGTTLVVPIPLPTARRVIPAEYGILEHAYRAMLPPSFPADAYPMMAVGVHDHDIQFPLYDIRTPDFSRTSLEFPFLDILGDNYSTFRWAATMLITAGNQVAIEGSEGFGVTVYPAIFDPSCKAYGYVAGGPGDGDMTHYLHSRSEDRALDRFVNIETAATADLVDPYGIAFLKNITNQPVFANDTTICDNYQRLFNTSLTLPPNEPVPVRGRVAARMEPFVDDNDDNSWDWEDGVFGWRVSTGFLEPPVPSNCADLKGFSGEW